MYATLLVLAAMPSPQAPGDGKDATSLLTAVANNVRSAKSWRIEGHVAVEDGSKGDSAHDFKFYSHPPDQARYEADDTVAGRTLIVCDDEKIWTYSSKTGHYARLARSKSPNYTDETNREWFSRCGIGWDTLAMGLASAVFAGHDTVEFDSKPRGCEAVRAEYNTGSTSRVLRRVRTVCIDPDRLMILRERLETDYGGRGDSPVVHRIETTTYSTVARDAELDSDLFIFEPPAGSTMLSISAPVPIYRPDPKYPKKAVHKRIEGTVVLSVVVRPDGKAHDIQVIRSLDPDFDKSAMECVGLWTFKPGEKDGQPVSVIARIEINFRLLDKK